MKIKNDKEQMDKVLLSFKQNKFDPQIHTSDELPNSPGNYLICLKPKATLFNQKKSPPKIKKFNTLAVIYTGISTSSLRSRDFRQHFTGNNAGRSTLRKSLGVLMGFKLEKRDKIAENNKTKFSQNDEKKLTDWMCQNLIMFYYETANSVTLENELIDHFNPPLNLSKIKNQINLEFRKELSKLRNKKVVQKSTSKKEFKESTTQKNITSKKAISNKLSSLKNNQNNNQPQYNSMEGTGCLFSILAIFFVFLLCCSTIYFC